MSFGELLNWVLWDLTRKRKMVGAIVIVLLPVLLAGIVRLTSEDTSANLVYGIIFPLAVQQFAMTVLCILYGTNVISSEVSGRTISFLVTRPTPRVRIYLAKYVGGVIFASAMTIISAILLGIISYGPTGMADSPLLRDILIIPIGVATYMAVFACLSALMTRPAIPAIAYVFAFETWVWVVPGDFVKLSIMTYVRTLSLHDAPGNNRGIASVLQQLRDSTVTITMSWNAVIIITLLALVVGCYAFSRGEYVPKEDTT